MRHNPSKNVARAVLHEELGAMERELDALRHQRRFQAACAAMQGLLARTYWDEHGAANLAVRMADELLAELVRLKP